MSKRKGIQGLIGVLLLGIFLSLSTETAISATSSGVRH